MRATLFVRNKMRKELIKKGDKLNRLTAIRFDHRDKNSQLYWLFRCDCGNEKIMRADRVKRGETKSCGCVGRKKSSERAKKGLHRTHGMYYSKEYKSWSHMKGRCLNKKDGRFKDYGARGIIVCKRWMKFENFYADMGKCSEGMTLDRIDNSKGYSPENCRWASYKKQNNNKRTNHLLTYNGKTQDIAQWAEEIGINSSALYTRIYRGWSIDKALKN